MQPRVEQAWLVPLVIPWQDTAPSGEAERIESITTFSIDGLIISLSFVYSTGRIHHIGPKNEYKGTATTKLMFRPDEEIVYLEMGWSLKGLHEILFRTIPALSTVRNDTLYSSEIPGERFLTVNSESTRTDEVESYCLRYTPSSGTEEIVITEKSGEKPRDTYIESRGQRQLLFNCPQGARFAGLYARASHRWIRSVGVIYEPV
ncbi:hypothetical protein F5884DRAFT_345270 [Xylogone sp. PMI_703]|nr:hypothetical protein F5884DRAFT_345270 [Xylogone sp. PMI_703]